MCLFINLKFSYIDNQIWMLFIFLKVAIFWRTLNYLTSYIDNRNDNVILPLLFFFILKIYVFVIETLLRCVYGCLLIIVELESVF